MTWFGHIYCEKCGHRHPDSDDCQARKAERAAAAAQNMIITNAEPVCRSFMRGLDDGPWLPGNGRARKRIKRSPEEMRAIRAKAWATRREKLGPKGHR